MVGDPGLGKSRILAAAAEISTNSVRTVGYSATTAGLTAHCFVEGGESHIEAGALVKANNGVCCIDELNFLSKEHRGSIHEVMEAQKISMAKGKAW
jgi:DNA replicative helicase MCM subunit Mcm2 (Cdc46/Mcm family)